MSSDDLTVHEIRAFVGPRGDYYLKRWRSPRYRINWAALLLGPVWLPYRKMYRQSAILCAAILAETAVEEIIFVGFLGRTESPVVMSPIVGVVVSVACGTFGNRWYLSHAKRAIVDLRREGLAGDDYFVELARSGGTSVFGACIAFIAYGLALAAVLLLSIVLFG